MSAGAEALLFLCAAHPGSLVRASPPQLHAALASLDSDSLPGPGACEATLRACAGGGECAELHLLLPAGWPVTAQARVSATSGLRPRAWEAASSAALQAELDADGLGTLLSTLAGLLERPRLELPPPPPPPPLPPRRVLLCALDHMHDQTGYSRRVCEWAAELGLRGRLLFVCNAILLLVEGEAVEARRLLLLLRTRTVDVDCRGRPCKERLLRVLHDGEAAPGAAQALGETFRAAHESCAAPARALLAAAGVPAAAWPV